MIVPTEKKPSVRITGYLEKRGKMRMLVCRWKRWWFVLEGRLLLYYKSQIEYLNLSPCGGSLNMGLASSVRPGKGLELTVITRSQTVTLRASNRVDHEQWLQSLVDAMALPQSLSSKITPRPVMHYRYASQEYHENIIERIKNFRCPSFATASNEDTNPMQSGSHETSASSSHSSGIEQSRSEKCMLRRVLSDSRTLLRRPGKRISERNSVRLSKIAFSDTSIPVSSHTKHESPEHTSDKCQSMQELRNSNCVNDKEVMCVINNMVESSTEADSAGIKGIKESKSTNSIKIELNLEDIGLCSGKGEMMKEQKIGNIKIVLDGCAIYGNRELNIERQVDGRNSKVTGGSTDYISNKRSNLQLCNNKEVKSDSDLAVRRRVRPQSLSCENMQTLDRSIGSTYHDVATRMETIARGQLAPNITSSQPHTKTSKKRSNSILSRFLDSKPDCGSNENRGTIRKRLSFLRKVWKKREKKTEEEDYDSIDYESIPVVIELPTPEVEKAEELLLSLERQADCGPEPEPPPDYDESIPEELELRPHLPPRLKQRPVSPWHDVPRNNRPVLPLEEEEPPPLPLKTKLKRPHQVLIKISTDSSNVEQTLSSLGGDSVSCEPPSTDGEQKLEDLDTLLAQLSKVNTYVVRQIDISETANGNIVQVSAAPEPVYDVPRPHISLLATIRTQNIPLRSQNNLMDNIAPTHFLCTTPLVDLDSLDPVATRLDMEMTPDSLECDSPWSLTPPSPLPWSPPALHDSSSMLQHFITPDEKSFPDSLNS